MGMSDPAHGARGTEKFDTEDLLVFSSAESGVDFLPVPHVVAPDDLLVWRVQFDVSRGVNRALGLEINGEVILGRASGDPQIVDLTPFRAADLGVSREHLIIRPTPTALYVIDRGSTNGTYRNGQLLGRNTPYRLANGDVLSLGQLELVVRIVRRPAGGTTTLQKQADLAEVLSQVAKAITSQLELDEVLNQVAGAAMSLTSAGETGIWLIDEGTGDLVLEAQRGMHDEQVRRMHIPIDTNNLVGKVIRTGQPVRASRRPGDSQIKVKTNYLVESLIFVPIALGGVPFGVLAVAHRRPGIGFSERDERTLTAIADFAAIAIQNVRLYARSENDRTTLAHILQQIGDPVIVIDTGGRVIVCNQNAYVFLDRLPEGENPAGYHLADLTSYAGLVELVERAVVGDIARGEVELYNEHTYNVHVSDVSGLGYALVMQDISHLKEIDRAKTEVIEMVSHQVRSPLTSILLYAELLKRTGDLNDSQLKFVQQVGDNVRLITETINDLLDLGKIEAGLDRKREPVSLIDTLQYAVERLASQASTKNIRLDLQVENEIPPVLGNPARLRQVFVNLIDNAIKYTPSGGAVLSSLDEEEGQIVAQVMDTGIGISLEDQQRIFDKFYRAQQVKGEYDGTGLGLAIVRSIVIEHEGRIWVDSRIGEGSTFTVMLPAYTPRTSSR
jgi:two-component system NtrC family sensor kinase